MVRGEALVSGRLRASNQYAESRELPRCQRPRRSAISVRQRSTAATDGFNNNSVWIPVFFPKMATMCLAG
jgi:hypothetical protein